jgi:YD repeat-containing protein
MEAQQNSKAVGLDVDHVRFSPLAHDFKATVYDHERPVSVISSSGSISRTVYYRGREMAVITDGQLEQVMTSSYTGRLVPQGSTASPPCRIVFYPDNGGLFETFDAYSFSKRWNDPAGAWMIAPGRLWHNHQQSNRIISVDPSVLFGEESSAVVRCYYSLQSSTASMTWKWNNGHVKLTRKSTESFSSLNVTFKDKSIKSVIHLPNSAELIIMTEGERFFIWIDSVLLLDLVISTANWSSFAFEAQGNSYVEDCVFMGNPRTEIEYMDDWGEKMQTIQLESDKSVLVKQILYDLLGRPAIETKLTRVTVDNKRKSLLTYHSNFISGSINPADPHSVWKSHRLQGEVDRLNPLDRGVPYFRTEYEANPLNEKQINGQPGPDFAVNGTYAMKFRTNIKKDKINVISNHFPTRQGFRYKMEEKPNGTKKVAVFDRHNNNRVALYVYVPGYDHLLSTYEYDSQNRLIKILPPLYHERVHTFGKSNLNLTEEMDLQKSLGTFMSYDETGRLIRKTTPDTGCVEYYYNRQDQIRLQVHSQSEESDEIDSVVYYEYDDRQVVSRTGFLEQMPISRQQFEKSLNEGSLSNAKDYQLIDRTEIEERHYDPSLSGGERNATFVIHNDDYIVIEDMRWDSQDRLLESRRVGSADSEVRKTFYPHSNRLKSIQYPGMKLEHYYNKLGQLIGLKLNGTSEDLVGFSYGGSGQLDVEYHRGFNRTF